MAVNTFGLTTADISAAVIKSKTLTLSRNFACTFVATAPVPAGV
jgi:hypothetical protein